MLRIAQMIKPEEISEIFSALLQSLQNRRDNLLVGQSLLGVKNRRKSSLKINNPVPAQIFSLFVSHALQRFLGLHDGDGVLEPFQSISPDSLDWLPDRTTRQVPVGRRLEGLCILRPAPTR